MVTALAVALCGAAYAQDAGKAVAGLSVTGDVTSRLMLTAEDLAKMPRQAVTAKEESGATVQYEGVLLREILKRAGAPVDAEMRGKALAGYVLAKARDGYQVVFSLAELEPDYGNQLVLVADKRDGAPLTGNLGPLRIVCPNDKKGARSVRMLESLEVVQLRK